MAVNGDQWPTYSGATPLETFQGGVNGEPLTGATPTGYYLKKFCNGAISLAGNGKVKESFHTWLTFRMGEFYLNYAEAVFKYLRSADATTAEFPMSARGAAKMQQGITSIPALLLQPTTHFQASTLPESSPTAAKSGSLVSMV